MPYCTLINPFIILSVFHCLTLSTYLSLSLSLLFSLSLYFSPSLYSSLSLYFSLSLSLSLFAHLYTSFFSACKRTPTPGVFVVHAGSEHPHFTNMFPYWNESKDVQELNCKVRYSLLQSHAVYYYPMSLEPSLKEDADSCVS